jgi:hypothetical protein
MCRPQVSREERRREVVDTGLGGMSRFDLPGVGIPPIPALNYLSLPGKTDRLFELAA